MENIQGSNYINGQFVESKDSYRFQVLNPADESELYTIYETTDSEFEEAVQAAKFQFKKGNWATLLPNQREKLLFHFADLIEQHKEALARLIVMEQGKLLKDAYREVSGTVNCFRYFAGWSTKIEGSTLNLSLGGTESFAYVSREPIGIVGAIAPWNMPLSMFAWKCAPALACGCPVIFKPSEVTPLSALYAAQLSKEVGFPPGVLNIVNGRGTTIGQKIVKHPDIHKITFTGSTQVGRIIGQNAAKHLKEFTLELGGKNPTIILPDADMDKVPAGAAKSIFYNQGQICVSGSRIYLHKNQFDQYCEKLINIAEKMKLGSGLDSSSDMGPLASKAHFEKVKQFIEIGKSSDAELLVGGDSEHEKGYFIRPTIFANRDCHPMPIASEEIFGPVLTAMSYDSIEDLIEKANDTLYGLSANIWGHNIGQIHTVIKALDAGIIYVNSAVRSDPNLPLGGFKQSGIGNELGKASIHSYTREKSVVITY